MNSFRKIYISPFILLLLVANFYSVDFTNATSSYQQVSQGDTVTIGEFVFEDDFTPSTTACTVTLTDPSNNIIVSEGAMTAESDGWHYYDYAVATNAELGVWRAVMSCGAAIDGDLVTADKSFEVTKGKWTVEMSDFGQTTVSTAYKARLQVLDASTVPTDADSLPTITITDSAGTVQVSAASLTRISAGTYSYSYTISAAAVGGVWDSVVSTVIDGETIISADYWSVSSSPADVEITSISDTTIPTITATVRIDNMGTSASDFYYVYCIVDDADNVCGGNDDIDYASATTFISAGSYTILSLTLNDVPSTGTYWFKVKARALAEPLWASATQQFTATEETDGGGGGGGGGGITPPPPPPPPSACTGADFNHDGAVNSIDFSILLAFWQSDPPFTNPCVDINNDDEVNSIDFSILLYQWDQ